MWKRLPLPGRHIFKYLKQYGASVYENDLL